MNCDEARVQLVLYGLGELSFDGEELLEAHLAACQECRAERSRLERMDAALVRHGEAALPAGLLARCRRDLSDRIGQERRKSGFTVWLAGWWRRWVVNPPMWLRPAGAVALLAVGFVSARWAPLSGPVDRLAASSGLEQPAPMLERVRLVNTEEPGKVRVLLEEVRQRELSGAVNDERIRQLLLAAANDPSDPGLRAESIHLLKDECSDQEVRNALLDRLRNDPNSGVRLKALEALKPYAQEPETRKALARVLLTDDNPGVRTQAIDLLTKAHDTELVGLLQQVLQRESNSYVRSRSERLLREVKASQGTF